MNVGVVQVVCQMVCQMVTYMYMYNVSIVVVGVCTYMYMYIVQTYMYMYIVYMNFVKLSEYWPNVLVCVCHNMHSITCRSGFHRPTFPLAPTRNNQVTWCTSHVYTLCTHIHVHVHVHVRCLCHLMTYTSTCTFMSTLSCQYSLYTGYNTTPYMYMYIHCV